MDQSPDLKSLADFFPIFSADGFSCGEWHAPPPKDGVRQLPFFAYTGAVHSFIKAAYSGWMLPGFNWPDWFGSEEARLLVNDPLALDRASPEQLCKLLTAYIRGDRFTEGALAQAFESGLMMRITKRASDIVAVTE